MSAEIPLHPDHPDMGVRKFDVTSKNGKAEFLISAEDVKGIEDKKAVRFMDLFNFKAETVEDVLVQAVFVGDSYEEARKLGAPLIHWIPSGSGIACEVVKPDASVVKGVAEDASKSLKVDEIIQFQRFGFVRVDHIDDKKLIAYFAHR